MILLPAIDLYEGKVVRLTRGDYSRMTVYREDPLDQAREFEIAGAAWLHTVDLEGARDGTTPNFRVVAELCGPPAYRWRWEAASARWRPWPATWTRGRRG